MSEANPAPASLRAVVRPFFVYAVFTNAVFQRGVFVLFLAARGFSAAQIGVLQAALYLTAAFAEIPTGLFADRFGRRASVMTGQLLVAAGLAGQVFAHGFGVYFLLFAAMGFGNALASGAETALLYDLLRREGLHGSYMWVNSRYTAIGSTVMAVAITLGGLLQAISWATVYMCSAAATVIGALVLSRVPEIRGAEVADLDEDPTERGDVDNDRSAGPAKGLPVRRVMTLSLLLLIAASGLMHATATPYFIFSQDVLHSQGAPAFAVSAVMAAAYLLGGGAPLLAGRASRMGMRQMFLCTVALLCAALAVTGLRIVPLTVVVFLVVATIPDITAVVLDTYFQQSVSSRHRARWLSTISFVESGLIGVGYLGLGLSFDAFGPSSGTAAYAVVPAAAIVLGLVAFAAAGRAEKADHAAQPAAKLLSEAPSAATAEAAIAP
jgi:MFS family permease